MSWPGACLVPTWRAEGTPNQSHSGGIGSPGHPNPNQISLDVRPLSVFMQLDGFIQPTSIMNCGHPRHDPVRSNLFDRPNVLKAVKAALEVRTTIMVIQSLGGDVQPRAGDFGCGVLPRRPCRRRLCRPPAGVGHGAPPGVRPYPTRCAPEGKCSLPDPQGCARGSGATSWTLKARIASILSRADFHFDFILLLYLMIFKAVI